MKKKVRLVLPLLVLPFLSGCLLLEDEGGNMPAFEICGLEGATNGVSFLLSGDIDLPIEFGLYNKDVALPPAYEKRNSYALLLCDDYSDEQFETLFYVGGPYEDCYWTYDKQTETFFYNRKASAHINKDRFDLQEGSFWIILALLNETPLDDEVVNSKSISLASSKRYSYEINDLTITFSSYYQ